MAIKGGYYIKARCLRDSWIAHSAPVVRETWDYLLREANHKERKYNGHVIKRGQLFRTYKEIRDGLYWMVGASRRTYTANQMKHTMKLLANNLMIKPVNHPRGVLITICNYEYYQNPKNYESTTASPANTPAHNPRIIPPSPSINKNGKELKNEKKEPKTLMSKVKTIFDMWNQYAVNGIKRANKLTPSRIVKIKSRLKEEPDIDYWRELFSKLQKIPFYCGQGNRKWRVGIDHVIENDKNHVKISEEVFPESPNEKLTRELEAMDREEEM